MVLNFSGNNRTLTTDTPLLLTLGRRVESARAVGHWQIWTGPNYTGECEVIAGSVNLTEWRMFNRIWSARPRRP